MSEQLHWLASYPKSGNTWVRCLLQAYFTGHLDINQLHVTRNDLHYPAYQLVCAQALQKMTPGAVVYYRYAALMNMVIEAGGRPLILKTHHMRESVNGVELIPDMLTGAAIYLIRDPRDVAVSLADHMGKSLDEAIDLMSRDDYILQRQGSGLVHFVGSWSKHVRTWQRPGLTPLVVRYEDLLTDPVHELACILLHLRIERDEGRMCEAVNMADIARVQTQESASGFGERSEHQQQFFRRGTSGHWQDVLTGEQVHRIERDHGAMMRKYGYLDEDRRASGA